MGQTPADWRHEDGGYIHLTPLNVAAIFQALSDYSNSGTDPTGGDDSFFHTEPGLGAITALDYPSGQWLSGNGLPPDVGRSRDMVTWRQFMALVVDPR
jgi:hypothetical protein